MTGSDIEELRARHLGETMAGEYRDDGCTIGNNDLLTAGTLRALLDELAALRKAVVPVVDDEDRKLAQAVRDANARLHQDDDFDMELELAAQHIEAGRITTCGTFGYEIENDRLQAELAALRSAQQWRGVESAPRDAEWIIGTDGKECAPMIWRFDCDDEGYTGWCGADSVSGGVLYVNHVPVGFEPTHWMPLPAAPLPATGADERDAVRIF